MPGQYSAADVAQPTKGAYSAADLAPAEQDALEKALNYHTGNTAVDLPMGLVQGAAKGLISTGVAGGSVIRRALGMPQLDPHDVELVTKPSGIGQGTGKFVEQAAEFAVPAGEAAKLTKGAGLLVRAGTQAGVGGAVAGLQSGGDPTATAVGAGLGGAGEVAGAATKGAKALLAAKAPTLANFAESFGNATPTQKARISKALPTLEKDAIVPPDSVHETQDLIKGKLADLGKAYENLDPAIRARQQPVGYVVDQLRNAQTQFTRRGVVTDQAGYDALQHQIDTVEKIGATNGGQLELDDLIHLKQLANGKTNFQSADAEKSLWKTIGNAYRGAADTLAPETKDLNHDYARYKDLEQIIDLNIDRGKGTTPGALDQLLDKAGHRGIGATAGVKLGGAVAGPPGAVVGGIVGGIVGPKLAKSVGQALQNAIDSGQFAALPKGKQILLQGAAKVGDNAAVLKLLGTAATEETAVSSR